MTTQNQPGPKPFVFGAERSTSTTSSAERPQTFFDCLEEQDQKCDTSSGSPGPARVTARNQEREAEERPPGPEAARISNNASATTANKFSRIGNGLEPFNIIGPSTGNRDAPSSLFGNPHPSDSEAAIRPSEEHERPRNLFGVFGARRPSTPPLSKPPASESGNTASDLFGYPPPTQTPGGLFSASATLNKHGHEGAGFGQSKTRGPSAQFMKDPPSVFDLPPPQAGNTSSSLFGNLQSSNYGQTPSAPSDGTSLSGHAPPAQASGGLFGTSIFAQTLGASTPAQTSGGLFGTSTSVQPSGGLFGASTSAQPSGLSSALRPAQTSGGLFGTSTPAPTSGGLFGTPTPAQASGSGFGAAKPAQTSGGLSGAAIPAPSSNLFSGLQPAQTSGGLFGADIPAPSSNLFSRLRTAPPAQTSGGLFGPLTSAQSSGGLFGASAPTQASGSLFGAATPAQTSGGLFGASTPALTSGGLFAPSAPAQASGASEAGAPPKRSGQNLQTKADEAWTQQQSKIQLALSSIQDAQTHGQEAHNSFQQERDQWQDHIIHLEKQLEEKQARIVAMTEQMERANEQANKQILQMQYYYSGSERPPPESVSPQEEWFIDYATNTKFRAMYACLRQLFSGELHPKNFLETIKVEDVWYDLFSLCATREVFLKDGWIFLKRAEGPSVAQDTGKISAGTQVKKNQTQITDTFKPNIHPKVNASDKKEKSDTSNVMSEPAASGNDSKPKPAKDTMGKIIKGRHGRIMSLGPSTSQTEEIPSLAKPSEALPTESTKALADPTPTDENNSHIKPTPTRSRSDSTPLPIWGKRSSSARPTSKDENDSAKQAPTPAIRPLIKEEWLTNEQRVSRIRKEEDETVERAMLRKRQQKGQ